eukprot:TRINITY_DN8663_c0_g1_i4.p1 TRINITY_DN8663_c0_g1~~TRINITY_DN8663_c0_g1_i4.p1  ORF type:complete len:386 (+),score=65.83 TRINITY_DN8663_c0_g1_i4:90-1247(+)
MQSRASDWGQSTKLIAECTKRSFAGKWGGEEDQGWVIPAVANGLKEAGVRGLVGKITNPTIRIDDVRGGRLATASTLLIVDREYVSRVLAVSGKGGLFIRNEKPSEGDVVVWLGDVSIEEAFEEEKSWGHGAGLAICRGGYGVRVTPEKKKEWEEANPRTKLSWFQLRGVPGDAPKEKLERYLCEAGWTVTAVARRFIVDKYANDDETNEDTNEETDGIRQRRRDRKRERSEGATGDGVGSKNRARPTMPGYGDTGGPGHKREDRKATAAEVDVAVSKERNDVIRKCGIDKDGPHDVGQTESKPNADPSTTPSDYPDRSRTTDASTDKGKDVGRARQGNGGAEVGVRIGNRQGKSEDDRRDRSCAAGVEGSRGHLPGATKGNRKP